MNSLSKWLNKGLIMPAAAGTLLMLASLSRPARAQEAEDASVRYDRGFVIESPDGAFSLKTQARVQVRYTLLSAPDPDAAGDSRLIGSQFAVQRARLTLGGHAFTDDLGYKFQSDFGKGSVSLKDFYVDYRVAGDVRVRAGQYKRPFSRQQITSSGSQELVDRAITDKYFGAGRDVGVTVHNNYEKSPDIEWAVGLFNGTGENVVPDKLNPALVARVGYNHGGIKGYTEADLEGGPLRFGVGASVLSELDLDGDDASGIRSELDYVIKMEGFSTTGGVYFATAQDGEGFADQASQALGFHVQAGYTVAHTHQVAGRYALIEPQTEGEGRLQEASIGYSLYRFEHGLKWQTDLAVGLDQGQSFGDDMQLRSQLQLSF